MAEELARLKDEATIEKQQNFRSEVTDQVFNNIKYMFSFSYILFRGFID